MLPGCTGCRCAPHAHEREVFITLWKSCEKACRDGLLATLCGLDGCFALSWIERVFSAERNHSFHWRPSPRLKSGVNPSLVSRVVLLNCQLKGAGGRPAPFDLDGGAWT